jgi:hypothetical protein
MNAILLAAAALGTLAAMYASPMASEPLKDRGSMTHTVQVDPQTGETTTIDMIAFQD